MGDKTGFKQHKREIKSQNGINSKLDSNTAISSKVGDNTRFGGNEREDTINYIKGY